MIIFDGLVWGTGVRAEQFSEETYYKKMEAIDLNMLHHCKGPMGYTQSPHRERCRSVAFDNIPKHCTRYDTDHQHDIFDSGKAILPGTKKE